MVVYESRMYEYTTTFFSFSFKFSPHRQIFLTEVLELNEIKFYSTQSTVTLVHHKLFRGELTNSV